MILLKTKQFCLLMLLLATISVTAQSDKFNRFSAEVTTGVHVPLAPNYGISRSKYIVFSQFQISGRYMFTDKFGVKGHYGFNGFSDPKNSNMKLGLNRLGLEGVANLGKLMNVDYRLRERFGLLLHTGVGVTFAQPSSVDGTDHMGNILVGLTGQIKLNDSFTLLGDMTYIANLKQQYAYNGELINANYDPEPGSFVKVSIGIMYSFGERKYHADWY